MVQQSERFTKVGGRKKKKKKGERRVSAFPFIFSLQKKKSTSCHPCHLSHLLPHLSDVFPREDEAEGKGRGSGKEGGRKRRKAAAAWWQICMEHMNAQGKKQLSRQLGRTNGNMLAKMDNLDGCRLLAALFFIITGFLTTLSQSNVLHVMGSKILDRVI